MKNKHADIKNLGPILIIVALLFLVGILAEPKDEPSVPWDASFTASEHQSDSKDASEEQESYPDKSHSEHSSASDKNGKNDKSNEGEENSGSESHPSASKLTVHFIDVGQADSALVLCDGKAMLIDGGNISDSGTLYSYLKKHGVTKLDYVIATHSHEDHVGGIAGALNFASVETVYCPVSSYESEAFENFAKYTKKHGASITVPKVGQSFDLGGASVKILGCNSAEDPNNSSIVLKLSFGSTSFLFTGDAEAEAERIIIESGADLSATVLKVGHHGSDSSSSYRFLREIMPSYAVISVGADNSYGHPSEAVLSRLDDADVMVYRTDLQGTVICESDGKELFFTVERNGHSDASADTTSESGEESSASTNGERNYVLNTGSKKFHLPSCTSVKDIKNENRKHFFGTKSELLEMGYAPCGNCKP